VRGWLSDVRQPVATDFLTVEVSHPDNRWMTQIARNLTDLNDGFFRGKRYLILDRDTKYSDAFPSVFAREGIHVIRLPPRSSNLMRNHLGLENRVP
jgi:hypothetical protein